MENAIWTTIYDLAEEGREAYLDWLHGEHIPEAMKRKGYRWAAHYAIVPNEGRMKLRKSDGPALPLDAGYALLFGGETTRTFLDQSPAQLEAGYDEKTRAMMGRRRNPVTYIHAVEWRVAGDHAGPADPEGRPAAFIQMGVFDASGQDEELGKWYAQERMDLWRQFPYCVGGRKLLATVGPQRHGVLYDFTSLESHKKLFGPLNRTPWAAQVHVHLLHPVGSSFVGRRIWPPA